MGFLYEFTIFITFREFEQQDDDTIFFFSVVELKQSSRASWTESGGSDTSRDPRGAQYRSQSHRRADGLPNFLRRALSGKL